MGALALSIAGAAAALLLLSLACPAQFYLNDDATIQAILAGANSGQPDGHAILSNIVFCQPLAWLYDVAPGVSWLLCAFELLVAASLTVVNYSVMRLLALRPSDGKTPAVFYGKLFALAFFCSLCLGFFPITHPDYSITGAITAGAGCSALALMHLLGAHAKRMERQVLGATSGVLLASSYCVYAESGIAGLLFACVITIVWFATGRRSCLPQPEQPQQETQSSDQSQARKNAAAARVLGSLGPLALAAVLCLGAWGMHSFAYSSEEWQEYWAFDEARTAYTDQGHVGYTANKDLYASYKWNSTLYKLVNSGFLMDSRISAEALKALAQPADTTKPVNIASAFVSDSQAFSRFALAALISLCLVACAWCLAMLGARGYARFLPLALFILMLCMLVYQCLAGHFLYRTALYAVYPAAFVSLCCAFALFASANLEDVSKLPRQEASAGGSSALGGRVNARRRSRPTPAAALFALLVLALVVSAALVVAGPGRNHVSMLVLFISLFTAVLAAHAAIAQRRISTPFIATICFVLAVGLTGAASFIDGINVTRATSSTNEAAASMYDYAREHPTDVFVYVTGTNSTDPHDIQPPNVRSWGGWTSNAPFSAAADLRIGYPKGLRGKNLLDEDVYFITRSGSPDLLTSYLTTAAKSEVSYENVTSLNGGLEVYSFTAVPSDDTQ